MAALFAAAMRECADPQPRDYARGEGLRESLQQRIER
jgi:hypothetical protein